MMASKSLSASGRVVLSGGKDVHDSAQYLDPQREDWGAQPGPPICPSAHYRIVLGLSVGELPGDDSSRIPLCLGFSGE